MKKLFFLFLAAMFLFLCACQKEEETVTVSSEIQSETRTEVYSAEVTASGEKGNIDWVLYSDGRLEIDGRGECAGGSWGSNTTLIKKVVFAEGITSIGESAFENCKNLTEVVFPESLQIIESRAFAMCGIKKLEIGTNLYSLAGNAFIGCELDDIKIASRNPYLSTDQYGVIFNKDKTLLILYSNGFKMNDYSVPASVNMIGENAFEGNLYISSLTLSEGLTEIGNNAFKGCENLRKVRFPKGFYRMGVRSFSGCKALNDVVFNEECTIIGEYAFEGCRSLAEITFRKGIEIIGAGAFDETLTKIIYEGSAARWENVSKGNNPAFNATSVTFSE